MSQLSQNLASVGSHKFSEVLATITYLYVHTSSFLHLPLTAKKKI